MSKRFKKFRVWKEAHELVKEIYEITNGFPAEEKFGLVSQLRRAAVSIPANLAEGCERQYSKEFIQFIYIARGSLSEVRYFIFLSHELGYLNEADYTKLDDKCDVVMAMLKGLSDRLEKEVGSRKSESGRRDIAGDDINE
ncbi:MAG: four helix bundle protein [Bacillota bacterium]|uniref:Four helix bundle protein n=1 Tax=Thermanaerosceptrum fracticalcis TaxID=1712410 RepID=A0A7G6E4I1_THEFR|nr:four helix bundle protein [Thermanaerosceptrum fracticalcis]QNB46985.1 four helix bundle protein [Thermanaerosceptrum fracticalcis]